MDIIGLKDLLRETSLTDLKGKLLLQMFRMAETEADQNEIYKLAIETRFMEEARIIRWSMNLDFSPEPPLTKLPVLPDQDKSKEPILYLT